MKRAPITADELAGMRARIAQAFKDAGVPYGTCCCGCGRKTRPYRDSDRLRCHVRGEPRLRVHGHGSKRINPQSGYALEDRGHTTPCWIWQHSLNDKGYGLLYHDGWRGYAHRWMYEHRVGPLTADKPDLDHLCRVPACCNPEHLEPVTHAENMRRAKNTRLTADNVLELRRRFETMPGTKTARCTELAADYGISPVYALGIVARRKWADLEAA